MADKGYDANYIADAALMINSEVVIPPRSNRKEPREYDRVLYKERNLREFGISLSQIRLKVGK